MNAGVYFVTQNTDDLLDEKLKNNLGFHFVPLTLTRLKTLAGVEERTKTIRSDCVIWKTGNALSVIYMVVSV